jgi:hypothetical protein
VLKRILTSLLLAGVFLVYWWRGVHGHVDTFTLGRGSSTETQFTSERNLARQGIVIVVANDRVNSTQIIPGIVRIYPYRGMLGYFLLIPAFWVAMKVRSMLPRPPGRGLRMSTRGSDRSRGL